MVSNKDRITQIEVAKLQGQVARLQETVITQGDYIADLEKRVDKERRINQPWQLCDDPFREWYRRNIEC